jgi:LAS superfamily LD-carboxypeptidase LdcB
MQALASAATFLRLAAIAAVLALVGLLGVHPAVDGDGLGARAMGPLPACRYDDILTSPRGYDDWEVTLVDTILRLPKTYAPPDLVKVSSLGVPGKGQVRAVMSEDLKAMSDAAAAAGNAIGVHSPYRSYATQVAVFNHWVDVHGYKRALQLSARPGHSEHQLGLGVDFRSEPPVSTLQGSWGATPAGRWMRNHAWEYGFVMSYPRGMIATVCYDYEPWHFRYLGRELAAKVHASGQTVREYLWRHFTTSIVPKVTPRPTAKPTPVAVATPRPSPTATPLPSSAPTASPSAPPATLAPPPPPPTLGPSIASTLAPVPPTPSSVPSAPPPIDSSPVSTVVLGGAALALGTIVLGGVLLLRRRGRSGVGL